MTQIAPIGVESSALAPTSLQFKIESYQRAVRHVSAHLSPVEFLVLMHILDRTVGWGVRETSFTGRAARSGDSIYDGMSISRRTWFRALASLEAKGIIRRRVDARFPDKRHYSVNLEWGPDMPAVNLPKRLKDKAETRCHSDTTPCHSGTTRCQNGTLYTGNPNTDNPKTDSPGAPVRREVAEILSGKVEEAAAKSSHAKAARVAKAKTKGTASGIEAVWRAAVAETFPGHPSPAWTVREKGQAKTAAAKWRQPGITFPDFAEWAARNWTAIIAEQFRWMTKSPPPKVPSLPFLFNFLDQFIDCYAEGNLRRWQNAEERSKIEQAMARGQTYEQAVQTVAEAKAKQALRDEMRERERVVEIKARMAAQEAARAERLAEFGGSAPVHPQSVEGLKRRKRRAPQPPLEDVPDIEPPLDLGENPFD